MLENPIITLPNIQNLIMLLFCIKFIYYISYVTIKNIFFIEIVFFVKLKKIFSTSVENDKEMFNICQGGDLIISNLSLSFFKREAFL